MPQIPVAAVAVTRVKRKMDAVLLAIFNLFLTGIHGPYVGHPPWSDDLEIRSERLDAKFETDLVVSFAGRAVTDCGCAFLAGNFNQGLCDRRACHRGSEQVFILIYGMCLHTRNDVIIAEIIYDIFNI